MPVFDIQCPIIDEPARIDFGGEEVRGALRFRGFTCEHEAACRQAGIKCALFDADGLEPFDAADAFDFFNG